MFHKHTPITHVYGPCLFTISCTGISISLVLHIIHSYWMLKPTRLQKPRITLTDTPHTVLTVNYYYRIAKMTWSIPQTPYKDSIIMLFVSFLTRCQLWKQPDPTERMREKGCEAFFLDNDSLVSAVSVAVVFVHHCIPLTFWAEPTG